MVIRACLDIPTCCAPGTTVGGPAYAHLDKKRGMRTVVLSYWSVEAKKHLNTGKGPAVHTPTRRVKLRTCGLAHAPRASCPRCVGQVRRRVTRSASRGMYRSIYAFVLPKRTVWMDPQNLYFILYFILYFAHTLGGPYGPPHAAHHLCNA